MKIAVLAYLATYGNAPALCRGFASLGHDICLIIRYINAPGREDYGFHGEFPCLLAEDPAGRRAACAAVADADRLVLIASPSLDWLLPAVLAAGRNLPPGAVVLTDSHLLAHPGKIARLIEATGFVPFAMPDLAAYAPPGSRPYYPPVEPQPDRPASDGVLRIGHSPGKPSRFAWKGTEEIAAVFAQLAADRPGSVETRILCGMSHADALAERARFDIFVDQVHPPTPVPGYPDYLGGIGKSGIEAMAAGCCVITSGNIPATGPDFPPPPVFWTSPMTFSNDLARLVTSVTMRNSLGEAARGWTRNYLTPAAAAARILEAIK